LRPSLRFLKIKSNLTQLARMGLKVSDATGILISLTVSIFPLRVDEFL